MNAQQIRGVAVLVGVAVVVGVAAASNFSWCRLKANAKAALSMPMGSPDYSACPAAPTAPGPQAENQPRPTPNKRYTDNRDGTITDHTTKLMWEKKVKLDQAKDPANLHDADNSYPWAGRCTWEEPEQKIYCQNPGDCPTGKNCVIADGQQTGLTIFGWLAELNHEPCFAGHCDWRIPTVGELKSLADLTVDPPVIAPIFAAEGCGAGCTDITDPACSCTFPFYYWSSQEVAPDSEYARDVYFKNGVESRELRDFPYYVRAVRGGA